LQQKQQKPLVDAPSQRLSESLYSGNDRFHHAFPRFIETNKNINIPKSFLQKYMPTFEYI